MKISLNFSEVNKILVEYLISKGKLENEDTKARWVVDNLDIQESIIEFEQ
jgi:hypothetical protein